MAESSLLRLPREIRLMIYDNLLQIEGPIAIGNKPRAGAGPQRRSAYYAQEKRFNRGLYKTTYAIQDESRIDTGLFTVNRCLRYEYTSYLYGRHGFRFGDMEAVVPFLRDMSLSTLQLLQSITIHKKRPLRSASDDTFWKLTCDFLRTAPPLRHLKVVLQGGQPRKEWDGPRNLTTSDLRLLYATRNECLQWVRQLQNVQATEIELAADIVPTLQPTTSEALILAAFSGSIETTLAEFMRTELGMPVREGVRGGARVCGRIR
ncbi:hypothetical protein NLG97_g10951 [Lecanicillium saksenae]|uniref:Uncharacterized protein n=1 Tax=Lecanicillium saksenae TaxID=468837 RepID=A0ACC1QBW9_9HYPO|nr:hypothetical protein NLG97_g10951 [Lecanicillium saksenae]